MQSGKYRSGKALPLLRFFNYLAISIDAFDITLISAQAGQIVQNEATYLQFVIRLLDGQYQR